METFISNVTDLVQNNSYLAVFAVFTGGLVSAASPCVLAAIPLIIGYVGGYSEGDKKRAALYSLFYVTGLSITFTVLGIFAALIGQYLALLGKWINVVFAIIAVIMGLHLLGVSPIPMPFQKTREVKTKGLLGAFFLGVMTATVSSPCATPILAVILTFVSTKGDLTYGGFLLFVYAIGHCALIFLAGLSVGLTESLIKHKGLTNFSNYAKKISGIILIVVGVYFLKII